MVEFENLLETQKNVEKDSDEFSDLALSDKLTGLYNERAFFLLAEQQQKLVMRKKFSALIIMLDIDNIELINEKYGEAEGSMTVISFAKILKHTFRQADVIARFADTGFVVLAIEITKNGKKAIISRLKNNIKHHNATSFKTYDISTSMGIAYFGHDHTGTIEELIKKAGFGMNDEKRSKKIR